MDDITYQVMLNTVHLPEDAGEYADGLLRILSRIPDGWGRYISCSKGWYPIIVQLDEEIAKLYPDYEVHQVKEKFGGLRYYCDYSGDQKVKELIHKAEELALQTCENCGNPGELCKTKSSYPWYRTLCSTCVEDRYLTLKDWDTWWEEEEPAFLEQRRLDRIKEYTNWRAKCATQRILQVGNDYKERELAIEGATIAYAPSLAREAAYEDWDQVFIGEGVAAQSFIDALAERFKDNPRDCKMRITSLAKLNGKTNLSPLLKLKIPVHGSMPYMFVGYDPER